MLPGQTRLPPPGAEVGGLPWGPQGAAPRHPSGQGHVAGCWYPQPPPGRPAPPGRGLRLFPGGWGDWGCVWFPNPGHPQRRPLMKAVQYGRTADACGHRSGCGLSTVSNGGDVARVVAWGGGGTPTRGGSWSPLPLGIPRLADDPRWDPPRTAYGPPRPGLVWSSRAFGLRASRAFMSPFLAGVTVSGVIPPTVTGGPGLGLRRGRRP